MKCNLKFTPTPQLVVRKIIGTIILILLITLTPSTHPIWFGLEGILLLGLLWWRRVPPRCVLRRLLILSPFVAGTALAAQYSATGVDWKILALRSTLCLLTIIAFAETTAVSDLLRGLRLIRVPTLLVTTLALMHRYLFVLADESSRMNRARAARTFTTGRRLAWLQAASVAGQLFVRATERAERVYDAMCARGWKA